jgi:succinate dehydrogenase hydrophobic membrane anchor protein
MNTIMAKSGSQGRMLSLLEKVPRISFYARTRGWPYVLSLCHRVSGLMALFLICSYIYSLTSTAVPGIPGMEMPTSRWGVFAVFIWLMAFPITFHSFNGGRLILYEIFGRRNEEGLIRWTLALSAIYLACLGLIMLFGHQVVAPFTFWLLIIISALVPGYAVGAKISSIGHRSLWKWQRITGAFLLVMLPAYILFTQLTPEISGEMNPVSLWLQRYFIKLTYLCILTAILFHGGYGLWSVVVDYLKHRVIAISLGVLITLGLLVFLWLGLSRITAI